MTFDFGPWILDKDQLLGLEEKLLVSATAAFERRMGALRAEGDTYRTDNELISEVTLRLKGGQEVSSSALLDLLKEDAVRTGQVESLKFKYSAKTYIGINMHFEIPWSTDSAYLHIDSTDQEFVRDLKFHIDEWVEAVKLSPIERLWGRWGGTIAPLTFGLAFSSFLAFIEVRSSNPERQQAQDLLNAGVNDSNIHSAVSLLLKDQFNLGSATSEWRVTTASVMAAVLVLIIAFVLVIRPRNIIGVGKLRAAAANWKAYSKIIRKSIPYLVLTGVLIPIFRTLYLKF